MAVLRRVGATDEITLSPWTLVGRRRTCALWVDERSVSGEHAVLGWREGWFVRDLASRNGTTLDGRPVPPGDPVPLAAGATVAFAGVAWVLVDDSPPGPQARDLATDTLVTSDGGVLLLPDATEPRGSVWRDVDGQWVADVEGEPRVVNDLSVISVGGRSFRLHLPTEHEPTVGATGLLGLRFGVSRDEERVETEVITEGRALPLKPRSHHYLLLTLARHRLADRHPNPDERGWIHREDLARLLKVDPGTVNVQLHRIRHDLAAVPRHGAVGLVESRPRAGQVRVSTDDLQVHTLDES